MKIIKEILVQGMLASFCFFNRKMLAIPLGDTWKPSLQIDSFRDASEFLLFGPNKKYSFEEISFHLPL